MYGGIQGLQRWHHAEEWRMIPFISNGSYKCPFNIPCSTLMATYLNNDNMIINVGSYFCAKCENYISENDKGVNCKLEGNLTRYIYKYGEEYIIQDNDNGPPQF